MAARLLFLLLPQAYTVRAAGVIGESTEFSPGKIRIWMMMKITDLDRRIA